MFYTLKSKKSIKNNETYVFHTQINSLLEVITMGKLYSLPLDNLLPFKEIYNLCLLHLFIVRTRTSF